MAGLGSEKVSVSGLGSEKVSGLESEEVSVSVVWKMGAVIKPLPMLG